MKLDDNPDNLSVGAKPKRWTIVLIVIIALVVLIGGALVSWYKLSLQAVSTQSTAQIYKVAEGDTVRTVATELQRSGLIRSKLAFVIYMRLHGGEIRSGTYHFNRDMAVAEMAGFLVNGQQTTYDVTFYPGATLVSAESIPDAKRLDVTTMLKRAGFDDAEIKRALSAKYDSPLFAHKPASADLEGYVFGDTYKVDSSSSAEEILQLTFDTFWQKIDADGIPVKFKAHGLNLYQGITLASIIQQEASTPRDQRQIAQVFYLRLEKGMPLGSDVTFIYAANKRGVAAVPTLDSPYNTRIHKGLPPGPIASPGITAMEAVANPASGDYLYFVAGDDGKIHYAKTNAEHEQNIAKYCTKLCS